MREALVRIEKRFSEGSKRLTNADVAEEVRLSPEHISRIKTGRVNLTRDVATRFQVSYGVRAEWLMEGTGPFWAEGSGETPVGEEGQMGSGRSVEARVRLVRLVIVGECPHCGSTVKDGAEECPSCHTQLAWPSVRRR